MEKLNQDLNIIVKKYPHFRRNSGYLVKWTLSKSVKKLGLHSGDGIHRTIKPEPTKALLHDHQINIANEIFSSTINDFTVRELPRCIKFNFLPSPQWNFFCFLSEPSFFLSASPGSWSAMFESSYMNLGSFSPTNHHVF